MYFVYIIKNSNNVYYKGFTTDPVQRLEYHNKGLSQLPRERIDFAELTFRAAAGKTINNYYF